MGYFDSRKKKNDFLGKMVRHFRKEKKVIEGSIERIEKMKFDYKKDT